MPFVPGVLSLFFFFPFNPHNDPDHQLSCAQDTPPPSGSPPNCSLLQAHSWAPCCCGQQRAEAQVSHGSSSCLPGLTQCWLVKVVGGGGSPFRERTTVLAPLPHPWAGLARGEGAGVCWKDKPRVQEWARHTDRICLEESLCPQWPKYRVTEFIRGHSNWGDSPSNKGTPTKPPGRRGRKTPTKGQPLAGLPIAWMGVGQEGLGRRSARATAPLNLTLR